MDREVNGDAVSIGDFGCQRFHQASTLVGIEFGRQRDNQFSGQYSIATLVVRLQAIPERRSIGNLCAPRQNQLGRYDTTSARVVVDFASSIIDDYRSRPVGRGRSGGTPAALAIGGRAER